MTFVLSFLLCMFEIGIQIIFCSAFLQRRCTKNLELCCFSLLLFFVFLFTNIPGIEPVPWKQILIILSVALFLHFTHYGKFFTKLLCAVFSFTIILGAESVMSYLLSAIFHISLTEFFQYKPLQQELL